MSRVVSCRAESGRYPAMNIVRRFGLGLTLALATPAAMAQPVRHASDIQAETGTAIATDGSAMAYEIGTLFVPENRDRPGGRLIGVGFTRVKAKHPTGAPPVVLLAGGPGVTMLDIVLDQNEASRRRV